MKTLALLRLSIALLAATVALWTWVGCNSESSPRENSPQVQNSPQPSPPPSALLAEGWEALTIRANYAKTLVDQFAHWTTDRNACGKDADGAVELNLWNALAGALNQVVADGELLTEARCKSTDTYSKMDGTAELTQGGKKKMLIEVRDSGICTFVKDEKTAQELIDRVTQVVLMADQEDCPFAQPPR